MLDKVLAGVAIAGILAGPALAADTSAPSTGPVTLDERQLEAVTAGNTGNDLGVVGQAFWLSHGTLARNTGVLPEPAQRVILLLHAPFIN